VSRQVPAGWPEEVPPPGAEHWQRKAIGWLYDLCPPDHRSYGVLRAHPVLLARVAREHVDAAAAACKRGAATARAELGPRGETGIEVPPEAIEALIAMYEREALRLERAARGVALVEYALAGRRFIPKL
jgi:hypothetical protein